MDIADEEFRPHSVTYLKLVLLWCYLMRFFDFGKNSQRKFYIDLLSASGLNYCKDFPDEPIPGSCFLVPLGDQRFYNPETPLDRRFERVFCFDYNAEALKRIEERRQGLIDNYGLELPPFDLVEGDANDKVELALKHIEQAEAEHDGPRYTAPLTLVFVDNLKLDIPMATIKEIQSRIRADLVVHLPSHAIWRCIEAYHAGTPQHKLTEFFGSDDWKSITKKDEIPALYHAKVQEATGGEFQDFEPVRIQGKNSGFHLCIYVRRTKKTAKGPGWVDIVRNVARECAKIDHKTIRGVRDLSSGKQQSLSEFMPP